MRWIRSTFSTNGACVEAAFVKSSHSSTNGTCIEVAFTKSSLSGGGNCVEAARCTCDTDQVLVRDSKDPDGPVLSFNHEQWLAFLDGIRAGSFGEL